MLAYHEKEDDTSDIWTPGLNAEFRNAVHQKRRIEKRKREAEMRALIRARARRQAEREAEERRKEFDELKRKAMNDKKLAADIVDRLHWHKTKEDRREALDIIQQFADLHGLPVETVLGPSRNKDVLVCRQQAIAAVIVQKPNLSYVKIGKIFGNRDHTTILNTARKMGVARIYA